jgi:hypothetical protein
VSDRPDDPPNEPGDSPPATDRDLDDALIDETSEESFPASDSPSSWSGPPPPSQSR